MSATHTIRITARVFDRCPHGACLVVAVPENPADLFPGLFGATTVVTCAGCHQDAMARMDAEMSAREQAQMEAQDAAEADIEWHREWDSAASLDG